MPLLCSHIAKLIKEHENDHKFDQSIEVPYGDYRLVPKLNEYLNSLGYVAKFCDFKDNGRVTYIEIKLYEL